MSLDDYYRDTHVMGRSDPGLDKVERRRAFRRVLVVGASPMMASATSRFAHPLTLAQRLFPGSHVNPTSYTSMVSAPSRVDVPRLTLNTQSPTRFSHATPTPRTGPRLIAATTLVGGSRDQPIDVPYVEQNPWVPFGMATKTTTIMRFKYLLTPGWWGLRANDDMSMLDPTTERWQKLDIRTGDWMRGPTQLGVFKQQSSAVADAVHFLQQTGSVYAPLVRIG